MAENCPTAEHLQKSLKTELDLRCRINPEIDAEIVLRYGAQVGSVIDCHSTLPRAMDYARSHIAATENHGRSVKSGTVVLADTMSRSKGRFTRSWFAPPGGIWGCLVHANTLLPESRRFVPLAVGVACCEAVRETGAGNSALRWVNDVLVDDKKLAGFLVEGFTSPIHGEEYNLVGFGINLNNRQFPAELNGLATSLAEVLGHDLDLVEFTTLFITKLAWNLGLLYYEEAGALRGDGFSGTNGRHLLLESWCNLSDTIGQRVMYGFNVMTDPQYRATVTGLDDDGGLMMRFDDGLTKVEYSGEIRYLCSP